MSGRPDDVTNPAERPSLSQPVGAFSFPAGLLLLPDGLGSPGSLELTQARAALLAGRLPRRWPEALTGHRLAHEGRFEQAAEVFASEDDPISRYNQWVLVPESMPADTVRAELPEPYAVLVDVVAYSAGLDDREPVPATDTAPEVRALAVATRATTLLERGDPAGAIDLLHDAAALAGDSALGAVLTGNAGSLGHQHNGDRELAQRDLASAVHALEGSDLVVERGELQLQLGSMAHEDAAGGVGNERALLQEAMRHYYSVLKNVSEARAPFLWASAQLNLATAHLASPMTQASDQLRLGVATQALRASRRVFSPEEHPGPWSTATLNLANALVYTPSAHQADNLVEAVELYQEVLDSGVRDDDRLGRARVLANQGNVLAHLGMFNPAKVALADARFVFEEHLDHDSAMAVRSVLDEIARSTALNRPDGEGDELTALARRAEQMSRMSVGDASTSGMGVHVQPRPEAKVTVLARRTVSDADAPSTSAEEDGR